MGCRVERLDGQGSKPMFPVHDPPGVREAVEVPPLSRRSRQRHFRRLHQQDDVQAARDALNWLSSGSQSLDAEPGVHSEINQHLVERVNQRGQPSDHVVAEAAARELLRATVGYDHEATRVASYGSGRVSLPAARERISPLSDLLPSADGDRLARFKTTMLRSTEELVQMEDHGETVVPYMDHNLKNHHGKYVKFIKNRYRRNLVRFTTTPKCKATVFFVLKKNCDLRLIVDARLANRMFRDPPSVHLATPEAFSRMEVDPDVNLVEGTADVDNCFHRLGIPPRAWGVLRSPPAEGVRHGLSQSSRARTLAGPVDLPRDGGLAYGVLLVGVLRAGGEHRPGEGVTAHG